MRYEFWDQEFAGIRCDLDQALPDPKSPHDLQALVLKTVLGLIVTALLIAAGHWLVAGDLVPLLVVWSFCAPVLTLILRKFIGPFDGWK